MAAEQTKILAMPESLNDSDYSYFKSAMDGVANSNSILAFVQSVLVAKYELKDGDRIELDGRIVRFNPTIGQ